MLLAPLVAALVINVSTAANVPPTLVDRVVGEAEAIWRPAGLTLIRNRPQAVTHQMLEVVIGDARHGPTAGSSDEPLAWIVFDAGVPRPQAYVSYASALVLLARSEPGRGIESMPILERETYLGRAMGRALAHEIGHFVLGSADHAAVGLMKATYSSTELFRTKEMGIRLTAEQQAGVEARLAVAPLVATSDSSSPMCRPRASPPPADRPSRPSTRG